VPVIFQKYISNEDLRRNPQILYVFGDNVQRKGRGGQAAAMRGEPNAVGVATKYAPTMQGTFIEEPNAIVNQNRIIDQDMKPLFDQVRRGGIVVWPSDGIGTGLAALPLKAPSTWEHLQSKLTALIRAGQLFDKEHQ
jgi:hypothetical protein